jgi:tRNA threonylcarbamoyladenosine biosynthesis protein TsaE
MIVKEYLGLLQIALQSEAETERLGRALAKVIAPGVVIGLVGPLGAGKTRLVHAVAEALGAPPEAVTSPTFVLIHEYEGALPIYHFDAYRIRSPAEFEALGAGEYFDAGGVSLVEWAERVAPSLPKDCWWIDMAYDPRGPEWRFVTMHLPEPARRELVAHLEKS